MVAIHQSKNTTKLIEESILRGNDRGEKIGSAISGGQINHIYKLPSRLTGLNSELIAGISGHFIMIGATHDLFSSSASVATILQRGG